MARIYVASHCRWAGLHVASVLEAAGHMIVSSWLKEPFGRVEEYSDDDRKRIAKMDFTDIRRGDFLVLVAGPDRYPGGKFVEAGIALGLGKTVIVIGRRENMLLWHPDIITAETPEEVAGMNLI
jgi:nucleoside 2-deoxyribosyltransferase